MNFRCSGPARSRISERQAAFTLIELLVVIAIIAILAAILFPVFAKARESARKATCTSNQREIGLAFTMYTQDFDESFPNGCSDPTSPTCTATGDPYLWVGKRWRWPVMPYLNAAQKETNNGSFSATGGSPSILLCPSDTVSGSTYNATSYGYSACFYHTADQINQMHLANLRIALNTPGAGAVCSTQTQANVAYPAQKVLIGEWLNSHQKGTSGAIGYWGTMPNGTTPGTNCWEGAREYVLADGHVKFIRAGQINPSPDNCPDIHLTHDSLAGMDIN